MQDLFQRLNVSDSVMVMPTTQEDFLDYDALFDDVYRDLAGMVKQNHIFSCGGDSNDNMQPIIQLRESNLDEHQIVTKQPKRCKNSTMLESWEHIPFHCYCRLNAWGWICTKL